MNPYENQPWDQTLNWDFFAARGTSGARIMLPTRSVHIMWFYNKEIFAKAGVQPPTTWDEFAEVCAKIKAIGVTPVAINYSYQLPNGSPKPISINTISIGLIRSVPKRAIGTMIQTWMASCALIRLRSPIW